MAETYGHGIDELLDDLAEAEDAAFAVGDESRELLRRIGEAGELVSRRRKPTEEEIWQIRDGELATVGEDREVLEWLKPVRAHEWIPDRREPDNPHRGELLRPERVCYAGELHGLVSRGLVALLAGGSRAVLTGAGRWVAEWDARRSETASEGRCGAGKGVL